MTDQPITSDMLEQMRADIEAMSAADRDGLIELVAFVKAANEAYAATGEAEVHRGVYRMWTMIQLGLQNATDAR